MVRITLEIEEGDEVASAVFSRVLYKAAREEAISRATFEVHNSGDDCFEIRDVLRGWMDEHGVSAVAVANYLGKATGTVKNWLYTRTNITDENQQLIRQMMKEDVNKLKKAF